LLLTSSLACNAFTAFALELGWVVTNRPLLLESPGLGLLAQLAPNELFVFDPDAQPNVVFSSHPKILDYHKIGPVDLHPNTEESFVILVGRKNKPLVGALTGSHSNCPLTHYTFNMRLGLIASVNFHSKLGSFHGDVGGNLASDGFRCFD